MKREKNTTPAEAFQQAQNNLFASSENQSARHSGSFADSTATTANQASAVQQSLLRTQHLLESELQRVAQVERAIQADEELLKRTLDTHKTLRVAQVRQSLTSLQRAQQRERHVLAAAVSFFWCAIFYVAWCRILIKIPFLERVWLLHPILVGLVRDGVFSIVEKVSGLIKN